jgi:hypothetical protein
MLWDGEVLKLEEPSELTHLSNGSKLVPSGHVRPKQGENGTTSTQTVNTAREKVLDFISHINPFGKKTIEETEISFSVFIQALQAVAATKCLYHLRRKSDPVLQRVPSAQFEEFSEYLH